VFSLSKKLKLNLNSHLVAIFVLRLAKPLSENTKRKLVTHFQNSGGRIWRAIAQMRGSADPVCPSLFAPVVQTVIHMKRLPCNSSAIWGVRLCHCAIWSDSKILFYYSFSNSAHI